MANSDQEAGLHAGRQAGRRHRAAEGRAAVRTATGEVVLTLKRSDHTAKPAVSRDGLLLGWSEPGGYHFIDMGKKPDDGK